MNCDLYCKGTRCFAEGTFVLTEYGIKKIEEIKVGDKIYGYDEIKGENTLKTVKAVYLHTTDLLVKIKTKKDIIFTTPEHPFYVNGQYILAGFLNTDMKLTNFEGKEVEIKEIGIIKYQKEQKVYNFSVEGTRNYYVGEERLLNHNLDDCIGGNKNGVISKFEIKNAETSYDSKYGITQSRINIAKKATRFSPSKSAGFEHVEARHFNPQKNAGQFTISKSELKQILQLKETVKIPVSYEELSGNFKRVVNLNKNIGTIKPSIPNVGGQPTNYMIIYTDRMGNLITTYPIPKP